MSVPRAIRLPPSLSSLFSVKGNALSGPSNLATSGGSFRISKRKEDQKKPIYHHRMLELVGELWDSVLTVPVFHPFRDRRGNTYPAKLSLNRHSSSGMRERMAFALHEPPSALLLAPLFFPVLWHQQTVKGGPSRHTPNAHHNPPEHGVRSPKRHSACRQCVPAKVCSSVIDRIFRGCSKQWKQGHWYSCSYACIIEQSIQCARSCIEITTEHPNGHHPPTCYTIPLRLAIICLPDLHCHLPSI